MADTQLGGSPPLRPRVTGGDMKNARGRRQAPQRAMDPGAFSFCATGPVACGFVIERRACVRQGRFGYPLK
eukprot:scaffold9819_cov77-Phaeocystis_antarctica.AAC.1